MDIFLEDFKNLDLVESILSKYKKELLLFETVNDTDKIDSIPFEEKIVDLKQKQLHWLKCNEVVSTSLLCGKCFVWWEGKELENFKHYNEYLHVKMCEKKRRK